MGSERRGMNALHGELHTCISYNVGLVAKSSKGQGMVEHPR